MKQLRTVFNGWGMYMPITLLLFSLLMPPAQHAAAAQAAPQATDWPQVQGNPQRTGFVAETLGTNFKVAWTYPFQPEKVFPQVQAIVYQGKVFVPTLMGNVYAIDATTGKQAWKFAVGSPVMASVAASDGKVFFGALDGAIYAVNVSNGSQAWKSAVSSRVGFSTAPLVMDGKVLMGGRNGIFYALDPATGNKLWQYAVGAPILQTAAGNNGRAVFGAMDMRVYALNTSNGTLAWKSQKIAQMAFKDYWPVIHQGKVIVRPQGPGGLNSTDLTDAAQNTALANYDANPAAIEKNLFVLNEATGEELPGVIHWDWQTMGGATPPPCVDRDGYLVIPAPGGGQPWLTGWARLNLATRKVVAQLKDPTSSGTPPAGYGNGDETMAVTCSQNLVLAMHIQEMNAHYNGAFNLDTQKWMAIARGWTDARMFNNTQGGGANPASVANGRIYHISFHELIARSTQ